MIKQLIAGAVVFTAMFYLTYDIGAYGFGGYRLSLSWFFANYVYSGDPIPWIVLGFTLGALFVHFTKWSPGPLNEERLLEDMNHVSRNAGTERLSSSELRTCGELDRSGRSSE